MVYMPFGELLADEHVNSYNTPFKFNAKEHDAESGLYYYGARYYDAKWSVWLSLDPLSEKLPYASPYVYCLNNPIILTYPDGRFPIPAHERIILNAWGNTKLSKGINNLFFIDVSFGSGFNADITNMFVSQVHFDGMQNFNEVNNRWASLDKSIENNISNIGGINKRLGGYDAVMLGVDLHTVADFYAHSNYVDLYVEYFKSNNGGAMPTDVPIYQEGLKIEGFKKILQNTDVDKNGKAKGLRTGDFNTFDNEYIRPKKDFGPNSHQKMNKDDTSTLLGKLAEKVATKHTEQILKKLE